MHPNYVFLDWYYFCSTFMNWNYLFNQLFHVHFWICNKSCMAQCKPCSTPGRPDARNPLRRPQNRVPPPRGYLALDSESKPQRRNWNIWVRLWYQSQPLCTRYLQRYREASENWEILFIFKFWFDKTSLSFGNNHINCP